MDDVTPLTSFISITPLIQLFTSLSPALKKDIYRLEAVQRRFTKRLTVLCNSPYCDRLAYLNLDSLFNRRIKSDLLLCYKFLDGHADVDVSRDYTDYWRCCERK